MAVYTAIDDPEAYFQVKIYAGDSTNHAITLDGDTDMSPNMVWIKERDDDINHYLYDSVRGVGKRLQVNIDNAEGDTDSTWFASFDSDGFSIGSEDNINDTGDNYVAWCWKEASGIFDIDAYEGTGSARTEAHSLSAVPHLMIVKSRDGAYNWAVYHHKNTGASGSAEDEGIFLNLTNATDSSPVQWNDTAPTDSVFSLGTGNQTNRSGDSYIAYLWSEKQGFSKFGGYTGNGNADGPFIYTGFRPAMVIIKWVSGSNRWVISDNKRDIDNPVIGELNPDASTAEDTASTPFDFLSNGFKIRRTGDVFNNSGGTYIYMAWAEAPFVNSNGVPCNAR